MGEESRRLTVEPLATFAPRTRVRAGALSQAPALVLVAALLAAFAGPAAGQARPDSVRTDTVPPQRALPDTAAPAAPGAQADSLPPDTIFYNLPDMARTHGVGWREGVWSWDHQAILEAGATTLVDLLEQVPGIMALRAGDFGTPQAVTAFGLGGGRIRVLRDGYEVLPLEGGVADLARVGLAGVTRVRVERLPGEVRVYLETLRYDDGRPYSLIEAGTGDLNTNLFRGTFGAPQALKGSLALAMERADSRGPRGNEQGSMTGAWVRYALHRGDRAGVAVDFRRAGTDTQAEPYAAKVSRSDLAVRGRIQITPSLSTEAYWGRATHKVEDPREAYLTEGGRRSQMGVRAVLEHEGVRADAAYRHFGGDGLPSARVDLGLGADRPEAGGFQVDLERSSWPGTSATLKNVTAWTRPVLGLSLFGAWSSGVAGARTGPVTHPLPPDTTTATGDSATAAPDTTTPPPLFRLTDRTATRFGVQWSWKGMSLSGARLKLETDSLLPLGIEPDRGQPALAGGTRTGWEAWASIPMPLEGLRLEGYYQEWDQDWSYLPKRTYQGALVFHRKYLASGNFEWWWSIGVRGYDPMSVRQVVDSTAAAPADGSSEEPPSVTLASVPFYQSWYGNLEVRIVTVRAFIRWENFTIRRNLQNFPDRLLPQTRAEYGIRWTMWN